MSPPPITRPPTALVEPTLLDRAFEDPGAVITLIERGSPYKTLAAVHRDPPSTPATPWFRNFWALGGKVTFPGAETAFHNPLYLEAAREVFGAEVVVPLAMMTNLNLPGPAAPPHLDLPFFRGAHRREVPSWLLAPMGYSGLFHHWAIPVASVITWFYGGSGGEFEYWPDGLDAESVRVRDLAANQAVIADNEYTYHRVCEVGSPDDFLEHNRVPYGSMLQLDGSEWRLTEDDRELGRYPKADVRLSVLWKAYCFSDQAEAEAFADDTDVLTPAQVVEIFQADLRHRGIRVEPPEDLAGEDPWGETIREIYGAASY